MTWSAREGMSSETRSACEETRVEVSMMCEAVNAMEISRHGHCQTRDDLCCLVFGVCVAVSLCLFVFVCPSYGPFHIFPC